MPKKDTPVLSNSSSKKEEAIEEARDYIKRQLFTDNKNPAELARTYGNVTVETLRNFVYERTKTSYVIVRAYDRLKSERKDGLSSRILSRFTLENQLYNENLYPALRGDYFFIRHMATEQKIKVKSLSIVCKNERIMFTENSTDPDTNKRISGGFYICENRMYGITVRDVGIIRLINLKIDRNETMRNEFPAAKGIVSSLTELNQGNPFAYKVILKKSNLEISEDMKSFVKEYSIEEFKKVKIFSDVDWNFLIQGSSIEVE